MRPLLYLLLLLLVSPSGYAQTIVCDTSGFAFNHFLRITAPSGVNLRTAPSAKAARIIAIPQGAEIPAMADNGDLPTETIDGIESQWQRVSYAGKTGYLFGGFAEAIHDNTAVKVMIPNAGVESDGENLRLSPNAAWYALAPPPNGKPRRPSEYRVLQSGPVKLTEKRQAGSGTVYHGPANAPEQVAVYFCGFKPNPEPESYYCPVEPDMLYPGEALAFFTYDKALQRQRMYQVYATGQVQAAPPGRNDWPFAGIRNYTLRVREVERDATGRDAGYRVVSEQMLFTGHLQFDVYAGKFDAPKIYMAGDFDNDKRLDILLNWTDRGNIFYLFLSSRALPGFMMRVVAMMTDSCC